MERKSVCEFSSCKQKEGPLQDAPQGTDVANAHAQKTKMLEKLKYETVAAHISTYSERQRAHVLTHTDMYTKLCVSVCACARAHVFVLSGCPLGK